MRHLQTSGQVYLDYTGAALYPETLLREHTEILTRQLFGNPHAVHRASQASTLAAGVAREALFHFLDADPADYDVVWTANASAVLRLVAEAFPFGPTAPFVLTTDNHNSVERGLFAYLGWSGTVQALDGLAQVRRAGGAPAVWIHGPTNVRDRGGTVAFNVLDNGGEVIDHQQVVNAAADAGICLRGGCFSNPGAAEHAFRYDAGELAAALDGLTGKFSLPAMRLALSNKPVGTVRASVGYASTSDDVMALLAFLERFVTGLCARSSDG